MFNYWFVIINPSSGNWKAKKRIPKILTLLSSKNIPFQYRITEYANHEYNLTKEAIKKGYRKIISVGGDGTLHNIINGLLNQSIVEASKIKLAVIPVGTGNDWIKNYKISKDFRKNISTIKTEHTTYQDIGKITFNSSKTIVYFNNLAGIGFDGHVVNSIGKYKKYGGISYLLGIFVGFSTFKPVLLNIKIKNKELRVNSMMTLIGLCKYSGGGMQLTENSNPTNGLFDITIIKHINLVTILQNILKLFNGKIVNHPKVETFKTKEISVSILDNSLPFIQADGELIKTDNFTITILPKTIQIVIPTNC